MAFVLWLVLALVPPLLGKGTMEIIYGKRKKQERQEKQDFRWTDFYLTGILVCIGITEAAHLMAVFLKWSFSRCVLFWGAGLLLLCAAAASWQFLTRTKKKDNRRGIYAVAEKQSWLSVLVGVSVLLQIVVLMTGNGQYMAGDITLETVESFLASDEIYQVNPLTGQPYALGIPMRLKILSLPTLYGALCRFAGLEASQVVMRIVPVVVLAAAYMVYYRLAEVLFGSSRSRKAMFLLVVTLLFWLGDYIPVMDGFGLLHAGFRGTTIRSCILVPYTVCLCLRGRWKGAILCVLAEACIVWTFYGCGYCLLAAGLLWITRRLLSGSPKSGIKEGTLWNS